MIGVTGKLVTRGHDPFGLADMNGIQQAYTSLRMMHLTEAMMVTSRESAQCVRPRPSGPGSKDLLRRRLTG